MRELDVAQITNAVRQLCIDSNKILPPSLEQAIIESKFTETTLLGRELLQDIAENFKCAKELDIPICQDTGMAVVFLRIGQDVHLIGGDLETAVNDGVRNGYTDGLLRCSIVGDPLERKNTGDNTPAVIHTEIIPGEKVEITVAPKGFGSENMSAVKMMTPAENENDIIAFVLETVKIAGSNPCPPVIVGIGIGGTFEKCTFLAKKALCRDIAIRNKTERYRILEDKIKNEINALGIGVQGFGGNTTALAVNIEQFPTHIAGLPVAVNMGCHVTRHKSTCI